MVTENKSVRHEPAAQEAFDERREQRLINEIMELLVTHHGGSLSEEGLDRSIDDLQRALATARDAHRQQFRKSGEPYFFHPLRVAHLAARHWMDFASVIAALLHDVVEDTPTTLVEIRDQFGEEVSLLVDGLTKVDDKLLSREALKEQTYRKQLLLAVRDIRVLCLKFWDRIDNLQTIGALNPQKQSLIAEETRTIYVPLAQHLGMGRVSIELDALSLNILYPTRGRRYRAAVNEIRSRHEATLGRIRSEIHNVLEHHKLNATVIDRWRPFSIAAARTTARGLSSLYTFRGSCATISTPRRNSVTRPSKPRCRPARSGCGSRSPRASWPVSTRPGCWPPVSSSAAPASRS